MSRPAHMQNRVLGAVTTAVLLAGTTMPALAAGGAAPGPFDSNFGSMLEVTVRAAPIAPQPASAAEPASLAGVELKPYALNNVQLGEIRGGFSLPGGVTLSFGFQQLSSLNGTLIQSILVPLTKITNTTTSLPVIVTGQTVSIPSTTTTSTVPGGSSGSPITSNPGFHQLSVPVGGTTGTAQNTPIAVSSTVASPTGGATSFTTLLSSSGVSSLIGNTASNQLIQETATMNITVSGLAQAVASQAAASSLLGTLTRGAGIY
jgi:hypothetical protein